MGFNAKTQRRKGAKGCIAGKEILVRGDYSDECGLSVVRLGVVSYSEGLALQGRLHGEVVEAARPDTLVILEHPHVFTLGRRGDESDVLIGADELARLGVEMRHTDRGGEVTYHGPGQLVGYPIVDLRRWGGGPLKYVRTLERVVIEVLRTFGIEAASEGRPTGVWVGERKIAAIGVKVGRRVTTHGFALNVCTDLSYFDHIVPCGMADAEVTSVSAELGREVSVDEAAPAVIEAFSRAFEFDPKARRRKEGFDAEGIFG